MIKKRIFEYDNYREFLKDKYTALKEENPKFSFRYFSRAAGFSSSSVLKMIIDGKRNMTPQSVDRFGMALKLGRDEARFFRSLVLFNQATTADEKQRFAEQLARSRELRKVATLKGTQYRYFGNWYFIVIRELVNLSSFKEDPHWIASQISPPIPPSAAAEALEELLELGLIERDEQGRLRQSSPFVTTPDEVTKSSIARYHKEMMKRASESINNVPRELRELNAVTLCISQEHVGKLKELARNFQQSVLDLAAQVQQSDCVYQINVQVFPLVLASDKEKKA